MAGMKRKEQHFTKGLGMRTSAATLASLQIFQPPLNFILQHIGAIWSSNHGNIKRAKASALDGPTFHTDSCAETLGPSPSVVL